MVKNPPANAGDTRDAGLIPGRRRFDLWVEKIPRGEHGNPFLPGEFHGQRSLVGYSPFGHKESDMTEATWHARMYM